MPPPIPAHMKRFTANAAKPAARYRPGKAIQEEDSDDGFETEEEEAQPKIQPKKVPVKAKAAVVRRQSEEEDEDGFETEEDEPDTKSNIRPASRPDSTQRNNIDTHQHSDDSESESEPASDSEAESTASSSSTSSGPRQLLRPTFLKKNQRDSTLAPTTTENALPESTSTRRLEQTTQLIKDTIERDTLARLAGKKSWDDEDLPPDQLVDDTDNVDPEAEHSAWRLRELRRLKRDREALIAREKELEETERRRGLTAAEREAEDAAFLESRPTETRSMPGELKRYHHKGAFFLDDAASERLAKRDLVGARFEGDVDKTNLPDYLRVRDLTSIGKKGRTRYTDLKGQDTGRFGDDVKKWRGSGSHSAGDGDARGIDPRFLPDVSLGPRQSGANASSLGRRRSRSRSPRRTSPSPYRDRDRDKRRRIET